MKLLQLLFALCLCFLLGCGPTAEEKAAIEKCRLNEIANEEAIKASTIHYFDAPCPGINRKLSNLIGDTLIVEDICGGFQSPLELKITSTYKNNTITNINNGQVVFSGKVCKHRDIYYLSEKRSDTSYNIYTLQIAEGKIIGFPLYKQIGKIDSLLKSGSLKRLQSKTSYKRLHPTKKEVRKLFTPIIASSIAYEIINKPDVLDQTNKSEPSAAVENDEHDLVAAVYPNPVKDVLNVELTSPDKHIYELIDLNGSTVLKGTFNNILNKVDVGQLNAGMYTLVIKNTQLQQVETIKIIKQD